MFSLCLAPIAEAKRGGYKSPKRTYTQTPDKPADNTSKVQPGDNRKGTAGADGTAAGTNRGFFSGGSLARGLMIGGFAGLLFGGLLSGLGALGDFLGLAVNLLIIYVIFIAIRGVIRYLRDQRNQPNPPQDNRRY